MRSRSQTPEPPGPYEGRSRAPHRRSLPTRAALLAAYLALAFGPALSAQAFDCEAPPEALIVTRHACKADHCSDPSLNSIGEDQADHLALDLYDEDDNIDAIFVTTMRRTQETAQPLADRLGLPPIECSPAGDSDPCISPDEAGIQDLLSRLCSGAYTDKIVLHVGHSNTLPILFEALQWRDQEPPSEYPSAKPWVITFDEDGKATYEAVPLDELVPRASGECGTLDCP